MAVENIINSPEARAFAASLAAKYGISEQAATTAMSSILPALIGGVERNTLSRGGIADLLDALSSGHHQNVINDPTLIGQPDIETDGDKIIGHLLGPSGLSEEVLQAAAGQSGVSGGLLRQIAPMVAVFLLGWLFRNAGSVLGSVLDQSAGGGGMPSMPGPPRAGAPPGAPKGPGPFAPLPDIRNFDTSNNPANNPYGNIADSIRRGGIPGGGAAGSVRDILGNLLGFGSSQGIVGWIVRYLVLRYGMSILKGILGSVLRRA